MTYISETEYLGINREADPLGTSLRYLLFVRFCLFVCHIRLELYARRNTRYRLVPRLLLKMNIKGAYHYLLTFSDRKLHKNFKNKKLF